MCGRITVRTSAAELQREFELESAPAQLSPRFNLCPTQEVPVVINDGKRALELYRWGLVPAWAKDLSIGARMNNARAETLAEKPSFRHAYRKRRCLILADGFYEWRAALAGAKTKTPFHIQLKGGKPFALAGLWEEWKSPGGERVRSCAVITTAPNALMSRIHDRMPVFLLSPERRALWLGIGEVAPAELAPLLAACPDDALEAFEVSTLVNSARNDRPECALPAGEALRI